MRFQFAILILFLVLISCNKSSNSEEEISFTQGSGVTDIDGNFYPSIVLGNNQEWTTMNLKTSTYSNGVNIPNSMSEVSWSNTSVGAWCHYDNNALNEEVYGKLYNFHSLIGDTIRVEKLITNNDNIVIDTLYYDSFPCKICPQGWRIPYEDDWNTLINYLGNANVAGGKMKDNTLNYWKSPNTGATNESGFNGLPGGIRNANGSFEYFSEMGRWWSFEEAYQYYAHSRPLHYNQISTMNHYVFDKSGGLSIRLIKI